MQATLHVHLIQSYFSNLTDDLYFGPTVAKMEVKFNKYYLFVYVILCFGLLINLCMKEIVFNNLFNLLYHERCQGTVWRKSNIKKYFKQLFEEYNFWFGTL